MKDKKSQNKTLKEEFLRVNNIKSDKELEE